MIAGAADVAKSEAAGRMAGLCSSLNARMTIVAFLTERLEEKQREFLRCTAATFEVHKGRCLELSDLIKQIEGNKE